MGFWTTLAAPFTWVVSEIKQGFHNAGQAWKMSSTTPSPDSTTVGTADPSAIIQVAAVTATPAAPVVETPAPTPIAPLPSAIPAAVEAIVTTAAPVIEAAVAPVVAAVTAAAPSIVKRALSDVAKDAEIAVADLAGMLTGSSEEQFKLWVESKMADLRAEFTTSYKAVVAEKTKLVADLQTELTSAKTSLETDVEAIVAKVKSWL